MPPRTSLISVVIPAWNEERRIRRTLEALFLCVRRLKAAGGRAEVIVVDNHSSDRTVEEARRFDVRIVSEERRLIAAVRNRGARAAHGDYLVFLDADSRPSANALVRIYRTLEGGGFVGGGVRIRPRRWSALFLAVYAAVPLARVVWGVSAGMIFATREAFRALGGFDERLFAAEDLEFAKALKACGRAQGLFFANLHDVFITTSVRKFEKATLRDFLIFPRYLLDKESVTNPENCRFWYAARNR
ncbi:MAG: glycosyltransferase [Planctomycetes bacterium]|nr:glycosyltransferase [Planctomycetota bacterium]